MIKEIKKGPFIVTKRYIHSYGNLNYLKKCDWCLSSEDIVIE